jgi:predicted DsbA family dithiol-disulfide isomerase
MRIDIWSDVVCPWCAIGVARFERALSQFDGKVDVRLHPFQLDPEAPIPGVPARERYASKFGDEASAILARVTAAAAEEGLSFDFDRAITANTIDAHRAIAFARSSGKDRELEKRLFSAYFSEGRDVSDRSVLVEIAGGLGIDRVALAAYLASDEGVDELRRELEDAYQRGISAVPTFVFEDEFVVPGAVDSTTFLRMLVQMQAFEAS